MREWFVIEDSMKNAVFAPPRAQKPRGYIPRDAAEKLLGRDLDGQQWFNREESEKLHAHPEWRDTEPPKRKRKSMTLEQSARKWFEDNSVEYDGAKLVSLVNFGREIENAAYRQCLAVADRAMLDGRSAAARSNRITIRQIKSDVRSLIQPPAQKESR